MTDIMEFIKMRYRLWSSRILIDGTMIFFLNLPKFCWAAVNSLALTSIAKSISYLFSKDDFENKLLSIFLVMIPPFYLMNEAGWYATTINYLWPLSCALIAFYPIKHLWIKKEEKKGMYLLYILALLFACNQEQCCALVVGFYLLFNFYFLVIKKEKKIFPILMALLSILSLLFIMTCPGNATRLIEETTTWFPTFEKFTIFHKLFLGMINSLTVLIFKYNIAFLLLIIVLLHYNKKEQNILKKIIYAFPFLITIIALYLTKFYNGFIKVEHFFQAWESFSNPISYLSIGSKKNIMIVGLIILIVGCIIFSLYDIAKKENFEKRLLLPILFLAGFLSVVILGFTPTIYASGQRTFCFLNYLMLIIVFWVTRKQKSMNYFIYIFGLLSTINTIMLTIYQ